jgi:hypothetical protein
MGNIVTCIKRTYNIQMPNGIEMNVESEKPLNGVTTARLLKEDSDISTFLENVKILDIKDINVHHEKIVHKNRQNKKPGKKLKKIVKLHNGLDTQGGQDITPGDTDVQSKNALTPCQRINAMITMEGELTRLDYQKFMDDRGHKISDFMGYTDIENAVMLKRITPTGERIEKGRKKYRIIDVMPVEEYTFRKMMNNHKEKKRY